MPLKFHFDLGRQTFYGDAIGQAVPCNPANPPKATTDAPDGVTCGACRRSKVFKATRQAKKAPAPRVPVVWVEDSFEHCAFCRCWTTHWTDLPDRSPGEQVAVCKACAANRDPKEVPSKDEWFEQSKALKLSKRMYVTTGDGYYGWQEYYSYADTDGELKQIVEDLMREGHGSNGILFWEAFDLPEQTPPPGTYMVVHYDGDHPQEPFDAPTREDTVHALVDIFNEDMEQGKDSKAHPRVWHLVEMTIETKVVVTTLKRSES